ncbi:MAG: hypothetical protein QNJ41_02670 [Xenococcaceae cyanobacterium MO_188.B32]|nr:hypothetical protein [Xenococcaceae cyanobacterium MO_188.B32]
MKNVQTLGKIGIGISAISISLAFTASSASAISTTYDLNFTLNSGSGAGSGTITFDDSLLAPNTNIFFSNDFSNLIDLDATFSGLATTPSTTSFAKNDLSSWIFSTNSNGDITDLNFFMGSLDNSDGLSIQGVEPFTLDILDVSDSPIASFTINPTPGVAAVPFEFSPTLGLLAVGGIFGISQLRKKLVVK